MWITMLIVKEQIVLYGRSIARNKRKNNRNVKKRKNIRKKRWENRKNQYVLILG